MFRLPVLSVYLSFLLMSSIVNIFIRRLSYRR